MKAIEITAMALGGLSLFAVSFLAFSVLSGKPFHEIAGLKEFAENPPTQTAPVEDAREPRPGPRTDSTVLRSGLGAMGAWSLPSPYSAVELKELTDELKGRITMLDAREADLDVREQEIEDEKLRASERVESLDRMRVELEEFQRDLELRELEVLRSEEASANRETKKWKDVASILSDLDGQQAGTRLVEFAPEEAASILRAMTPEDAATILNAIEEARWKEYVDAYTRLQADD